MPSKGWKVRKDFSLKMQKVAIEKYYPHVWPRYKIVEIDELNHDLAVQIDIGGGDKMLVGKDGHLAFVGQRFRKITSWYRDFTIREAEYNRHLRAIQSNGFVPGYYVLGYANEYEDDFSVLYIIDYRLWLSDIVDGKTRMDFKETKPKNQENFYYCALNKIPEIYIITKFTISPTGVEQSALF